VALPLVGFPDAPLQAGNLNRIHLELYPFSFYDPVRRKWVRAAYKAELATIQTRYQEYRIDGPPEVRDGPLDDRILGDHAKP
jgi:hypothetical protein